MNMNEIAEDIGSPMIMDTLVSLGLLHKLSSLIEPPPADADVLSESVRLLKFRVNNKMLFTDTTFPP
jgi:hypothetical protein